MSLSKMLKKQTFSNWTSPDELLVGDTLDDVIDHFRFLKDAVLEENPDAENIRFTIDLNWDYSDIHLVYDRLETDKEFDKRQKKWQKDKDRRAVSRAKKEREELAELQRLADKHGVNLS